MQLDELASITLFQFRLKYQSIGVVVNITFRQVKAFLYSLLKIKVLSFQVRAIRGKIRAEKLLINRQQKLANPIKALISLIFLGSYQFIICWDNITCSRVVTWSRGHVCRGTSVARSLKLLALPFLETRRTTIILSTNRSYVISPCVTNIITLIFFRSIYILFIEIINLRYRTSVLQNLYLSISNYRLALYRTFRIRLMYFLYLVKLLLYTKISLI